MEEKNEATESVDGKAAARNVLDQALRRAGGAGAYTEAEFLRYVAGNVKERLADIDGRKW